MKKLASHDLAVKGKPTTPNRRLWEIDHCHTWEALANALGIDRRNLLKVRTRHANDPSLPKPKADGRHQISAWKEFFLANDINPNRLANEADDDPDSPASWKARLIEQQVIRATLANELTKRQQVPMAEIQTKLSAWAMGVRREIDALVPDLSQSLEGIDDYHEREEIIQDRIDKMLLALQSAPWLDETPLEFEGE